MIKNLKDLPLFLSIKDLVGLGLFKNGQAVHKARRKGEAPPEIYISTKVIKFPKDDLLQWLKDKEMGHE